MSNPVITRLGINQFWYKHWYSDKFFSENLKQDISINNLVKLYLDYGLTFNSNPLVHDYWYKPTLKKLKQTFLKKKMLSYRRFFYTNQALDIDHSYLLRNKTGEYFPMKFWLFRYSGWVIFSVKWFKPFKVSKKTRFFSKTHLNVSSIFEVSKTHNNLTNLKRLKIIIYLFLKKFNSLNKEYFF